jgi:membrane associated rhomboid family serine protease
MFFDPQDPAATSGAPASRLTASTKIRLSYVAIAALISASTGALMLCPCDSVGIRDHYAIFLVALSALFGIAAAFLVYRRMKRDSAITAFLKAVSAIAIVVFAVYAELFVAMEAVAWLARIRK